MANKYSFEEIALMTPREFRSVIRKGDWKDTTHEACRGHAFAGLVILPKEYAYDFLLFCQRNPRPFPVLDVTEPGNPHPMLMGPDADLRTDLPRYRVFKDGKVVDEPENLTDYWRDDLVGFLLGCSAGIDTALKKANVNYRLNGIFNSNIKLVPAGAFHGLMAVSCRTFLSSHDAVRAIQISSRLIASHGPPIHIGRSVDIGIGDLSKSDYPMPHKSIPPESNEIALFWGCSVSAQNVAVASKAPYLIVHYPGRVFTTDKLVDEVAIM